METKNQTGDQEQKVDYDNLEQYTKQELINICNYLNLPINKKKNKDFIIKKIQCRIKGKCEVFDSEGEICSKKAVVSNSNRQQVCFEHQVGRTYCIEGECKTRATFSFKGQKALYCDLHKKDNMIDVKHKTCSKEKCKTRCSYGFEWQKPIYCADHKEPDMFDVVSKKCLKEFCKKIPGYGLEGQKPLYCFAHKEDNMVNVKDKKTCSFDRCQTRPSYGFKLGKKLYCVKHKQPKMFDVNHKKCSHYECQIRPSYGFEIKKPIYCELHKQSDMFDVVNKICLEEGCKTINIGFGNYLTGRIHCAKHYDKKTEWKLSTCKSSKCRKIAIYSQSGNYPYEFCDDHSPNNYSSNLTSTCNNCNLSDLICDEEGRCLLACSQIHKERIKFSETELNKFLNRNNLKFTSDKIEDNSCSKKRPDFIFKTSYGVIIIENDENQHKSYPCECEQARMIQIHQDFGESVHFIRFNPDRYISEKENLNLQQRHKILLKEVLKPILNHCEDFFIRNQGLTVRYMYYDNCDGKFSVQQIFY